MKITYLGHSGFLVELEKLVLMFDYFQGDIPVCSKDKIWYVFASHRHRDHFSPKIFRLAQECENLHFIFSRDIWRSQVPENLQEIVVQIKAKERWEDENIQVETLKSTDEGVAFLVQAEGHVLYHAGDLNNWQWKGESEEWNRKMEEQFKECLEPLRGKKIDAAFIPLDPRQEENYSVGMDYFLKMTGGKKVYPMHCWEKYSVIEQWFAEHPNSPYRENVVKITRRGEEFLQE